MSRSIRIGSSVAVAAVPRAAFEIAGSKPEPLEDAQHRIRMPRLPAVRGAGERELGIAVFPAIGRAGLDQRQGLQALDGRARIDRRLDVAPDLDRASGRIEGGEGDGMAALDHVAPADLDDERSVPGTARLRIVHGW